jgi:hypothetical protein
MESILGLFDKPFDKPFDKSFDFPTPAVVAKGINDTYEKKKLKEKIESDERRESVLCIIREHLCDLANGKTTLSYPSDEKYVSLLNTYQNDSGYKYKIEVQLIDRLGANLTSADIKYIQEKLLSHGYYMSKQNSFGLGVYYLIIGWND